jgi:hypothetical protein
MPSSPIDDPEHWPKRAEEARALAIHMEPMSKEMMLGIAKDYERLAERAAERAKGERLIQIRTRPQSLGTFRAN